MKSIRMFFRSFRDAFKSVIRNFSLSLASVTCITVTLVIIGTALLVSENVRNFTEEIEKDVTIVTFLDTDVTEEEKVFFEEELKKMENIDSYLFKSKTEVKDEMAMEYEELKEVLDDWDAQENPLKDTYTIKVIEIDNIKATAKAIQDVPKVSTVKYGEGLVEKLLNLLDTVKKITYIVAIALTAVTIFLVINTIKLTIFSRKKEISIMRLVGSSNIRIKLPFIVEGIFLGLMGSIIPIVTIVYGYNTLFTKLNGVLFSSTIKLISPTPFVFEASLVVISIGILVGMIGSAGAVRRYIKV